MKHIKTLIIQLRKDNKSHTEQVHRLVAKTFLPNPDNLAAVDHINRIRTKTAGKLHWEWC